MEKEISYESIIQNISTTINNEGIINELGTSTTEMAPQSSSAFKRLRGISDSLKGLKHTIKWFQTWEPIEEKIPRCGEDISQPQLFDDIFGENKRSDITLRWKELKRKGRAF